MYEHKKRSENGYSGTDLMFVSFDIVEELRDMEDGEVTTTLQEAEKLGYTELNHEELFKLHKEVLTFAKRNKIDLEMTPGDDDNGRLPYRYAYEVHNKKAQIKCPLCGSKKTCRILYGNPKMTDTLKSKIKVKKIRISKRKPVFSNIGGYTLDGLPHRYCNDCKSGFAKSPVLYNKKIDTWETYLDQVQTVRFLVGGYFGGSTEIFIEETYKGALVTIRSYAGEFRNEEMLPITLRKWTDIVVKLYSRMYLCDWKKEYKNPDILDGEGWELEIKLSDDRVEYYSGSNAYPPYWPELKKVFQPYIKRSEKWIHSMGD